MDKKAWLKLIETKLALLEPDAHTDAHRERRKMGYYIC